MALYAFAKFDNFKEAIDFVVRSKGDTDTNACVAGYLLGAFYGYSALSSDPVTRDNIRTLLACDTSQSTDMRPEKYLARTYLSDANVDKLASLCEK